MKQFFKLATLFFMCASPNLCLSASLNNYLDFYMGADAQVRTMKFKEGFGDNLLKKTSPQGNLYVGFMLSDNVGLEVGYESASERSCRSTLMANDCCAGRSIPGEIEPAIFKTKLKIKGPHASLILFCPLSNYPISFLAGIGISSVKATAEIETLALSRPPVCSGSTRTLSKHKGALRLSSGVQYMTEGNLGFRGTINFIKTRKIVLKKRDDNIAVQIPRIKLRDSMVYGLGCFWAF